ncbi:AraC family transcriptional regulator [Parasphingorhabdus sp.]|uniref:AraC family transcriptional regulator n=1 Tax=Parasphingorhabdus sp. TaxID=2709688 RepID=UPI003001F4E3
MEGEAEFPTAKVTVIATWLIHLVAIVDEFYSEFDTNEILQEVGINPELLNDPNARVPSWQVSKFYEIIQRITGDEAIGLKLGARLTPGSMHALGYSLFASRTLNSFFVRYERFFQLISQAGNASTQIRDKRLVFSLTVREKLPPTREDAFLATVLRFARMVYRSNFSPILVRMPRPKPKFASAEFDDYFCCPIEYGCERLELHVSESDSNQRLRGFNPEFVRAHDQIATEYIARFDDEQIIPRIQSAIVNMLPDGDVSIRTIASALGMSNRSLQRQLQNEGSTFNAVLDGMRKYLAIRYLRSGRHSIKEMSYLLGYNDSSNFSRAFRRLTGRSPHEYLEKSKLKSE